MTTHLVPTASKVTPANRATTPPTNCATTARSLTTERSTLAVLPRTQVPSQSSPSSPEDPPTQARCRRCPILASAGSGYPCPGCPMAQRTPADLEFLHTRAA
jgi:hypothetical protein